MASTEVEICNLALDEMGLNTIAALTGTDKASTVMNRHYGAARDGLLERFDWTFSRKRVEYNSDVDALVGKLILEDDFLDNAIDTTKWVETDTGGVDYVKEQNNRLEMMGSGNPDEMGLVAYLTEDVTSTKHGHVLNENLTVSAEVTIVPFAANPNPDAWFGFYATSDQSLEYTYDDGIALYIKNDGTFSVYLNGSEVTTTHEWIFDAKYRITIRYMDPGWEIYVESDEDDTYEDPVKVYTTTTDSTGPVFYQMQCQNGLIYVDNVRIMAEYAPPFEYDYRYPLPADCMRVKQCNGSTSNYVVEKDKNGKQYLLISDDSVDLKYIAKVTDVTQYPQIFVDTLVASLIARTGTTLTGNTKLVKDAKNEVRHSLYIAMTLDAIEQDPEEDARQSEETSLQKEGRS